MIASRNRFKILSSTVGPESDHLAEAQQDAQLAPQEIASVVAMYELGHLESVRPFAAGSSRAPKAKVVTDSGAFLLKRLAPSRTNLDRLRFQHQVIQHLSEAGFPVAEVQRSRLNQTIAERGSHYYELSRWIDGHRYHYCPKEAKASGSAMAAMHDLLILPMAYCSSLLTVLLVRRLPVGRWRAT